MMYIDLDCFVAATVHTSFASHVKMCIVFICFLVAAMPILLKVMMLKVCARPSGMQAMSRANLHAFWQKHIRVTEFQV